MPAPRVLVALFEIGSVSSRRGQVGETTSRRSLRASVTFVTEALPHRTGRYARPPVAPSARGPPAAEDESVSLTGFLLVLSAVGALRFGSEGPSLGRAGETAPQHGRRRGGLRQAHGARPAAFRNA